jgi:hypothetical protein
LHRSHESVLSAVCSVDFKKQTLYQPFVTGWCNQVLGTPYVFVERGHRTLPCLNTIPDESTGDCAWLSWPGRVESGRFDRPPGWPSVRPHGASTCRGTHRSHLVTTITIFQEIEISDILGWITMITSLVRLVAVVYVHPNIWYHHVL